MSSIRTSRHTTWPDRYSCVHDAKSTTNQALNENILYAVDLEDLQNIVNLLDSFHRNPHPSCASAQSRHQTWASELLHIVSSVDDPIRIYPRCAARFSGNQDAAVVTGILHSVGDFTGWKPVPRTCQQILPHTFSEAGLTILPPVAKIPLVESRRWRNIVRLPGADGKRVKGTAMTDSPDPTADAGPAAAAVPADMLPLELMILDHYARQSRCLLSSLPAILGRDEKDDVRLADPWISHSHCELFQQGGVLVVRDLDSKNGVFMHGVRIREAEVLPGDCLTLGRTEITFRYRRATAGEDSAADEARPPCLLSPRARRLAGRLPAARMTKNCCTDLHPIDSITARRSLPHRPLPPIGQRLSRGRPHSEPSLEGLSFSPRPS